MEAVIIGVILLIGAAALWHYGGPNPVILLAVVALAIVGAILLVVGLVDVADTHDHVNAAVGGPLSAALRASRKRGRRFEKIASGLRANRVKAVRGSGTTQAARRY